MRLGLLTTVWQRPRLTTLVLDYYASLKVPGVQLVPVAVASPSDETATDQREGWHTRWHPNDPLGLKWNIGLREMAHRDVDAVMIIGSDDLVTPAYFARVRTLLDEGAQYIYPKNLHVYDTASRRLVHLSPCRPGAGRVVSRSVLEAADWHLWQDDKQCLLDGSMERAVKAYAPETRIIDNGPTGAAAVLDVKTGTNMWRLDGDGLTSEEGRHVLISEVTELDAGAWLPQHYPGVADELIHWKQGETA